MPQVQTSCRISRQTDEVCLKKLTQAKQEAQFCPSLGCKVESLCHSDREGREKGYADKILAEVPLSFETSLVVINAP
jgi:hypothetical protein